MKEEESEIIFHSKKDSNVIFRLWSGIIAYFAIGLFVVFTRSGFAYDWGWLLVLVGAIIFAFVHPVYYKITQNKLIIRSGLIKWRIPFTEIVEIFPSSLSSRSAPALSVDRLQINYIEHGKKYVLLISPESKSSFLDKIVENAAKNGVKFDVNFLHLRKKTDQ